MQIQFQPMISVLTPMSVAIGSGVLVLALVLYVALKRSGKNIQALLAPVVLLSVFTVVLNRELSLVYSMQRIGELVVLEKPLGSNSTECRDIEFIVKRGRGGCNVDGYRGDVRLFETVEVEGRRCQSIKEQLQQFSCKPSDRDVPGRRVDQ